MNEIEDAVFAGIKACDEAGPGDGALWRSCCLKPAEVPFIAQLRQIRKSNPMALDECRVHSVHAEHNEFGSACCGTATSRENDTQGS